MRGGVMPMSDPAHLIRGCIKGDKTSWESFVKIYGKLVNNAIKKTFKTYCRDDLLPEVDDVFQDVFKKLLEHDYHALKGLRKETSLEPWLCTIAHNKALDYLRKKKSPAQLPLLEIGEPKIPYPRQQEEQVMMKEVLELLEKVLDGLKPQERLIFTLFYLDGRGYKDIAEIMGLPMNTVATKLFRVRNKMRDKLQSYGILGEGKGE